VEPLILCGVKQNKAGGSSRSVHSMSVRELLELSKYLTKNQKQFFESFRQSKSFDAIAKEISLDKTTTL
jgi:hypothetical protein